MSVVSNSTPLISLAAIGALDLLEQFYVTIVVPQAVHHEVVVAGAGKTGAQAVANAAWIQVQTVKNTQAVGVLMSVNKLDRGESEAIVLMQEINGSLILLDDQDARRVAQQSNLPMIGTVGVLLLAKQRGLITLVRPQLDALIAADVFLDSSLYNLACQLAGE
jgi:hypothetical protein